MADGSTLPVEVIPSARRQLDIAHAWWEINRTAAPNAIRDDFEAMARLIARNPKIGRHATKTKTRNVRQVYLRRVGYFVYYRVIGSPPFLEIMAFWHSRRGKGPPI
ncbi:MAG: type II toxin-antitoxin system RelE/ParE family toxin [Thermoanaerobaculia bacterium]